MFTKKLLLGILFVVFGHSTWAHDTTQPQFVCMHEGYKVSIWPTVEDMTPVTIAMDENNVSSYLAQTVHGTSGVDYWHFKTVNKGDLPLHLSLAQSPENPFIALGQLVTVTKQGERLRTLNLKCIKDTL